MTNCHALNAEKDQAEGVQENKAAGHKGGKLAKQARLQFEDATGLPKAPCRTLHRRNRLKRNNLNA